MAEAKGKGGKDADRQKSVFVITPIGAAGSPEREHADFVLHGAIEPIFGAKGYKVERADKMADPAMINDGIFNAIFEADICIADLTFTNANVFYELGVRHTLLKPVIHIADEETRIPFDNAQHRAILFRRSNWASFEGLKAGLLAQLEAIEEDGFKVSNPITHARGRIAVAQSGDDRDKLISDLMARMEDMERSLRQRQTRNALADFDPSRNALASGMSVAPKSSTVVRLAADIILREAKDSKKREDTIFEFRKRLSGIVAEAFPTFTPEGRTALIEHLKRENISPAYLDAVQDTLFT